MRVVEAGVKTEDRPEADGLRASGEPLPNTNPTACHARPESHEGELRQRDRNGASNQTR